MPVQPKLSIAVMLKFGTYRSYSITCALVWAGALMFVSLRFTDRFHAVGLVCADRWIGWLSSTIARAAFARAESPETPT